MQKIYGNAVEFCQITNAIIKRISSYLDVLSFDSLQRTCRQCHYACNNPIQITELYCHYLFNLLESHQFRKLYQMKKITDLDIMAYELDIFNMIKDNIPNQQLLPNLVNLTIETNGENAMHISVLTKHKWLNFGQLTTLFIRNNNSEQNTIPNWILIDLLSLCSHLKTFSVSNYFLNWPEINPSSSTYFSENYFILPKLEILSLDIAMSHCETQLCNAIIQSCSKTLKILHIGAISKISALHDCKNLEELCAIKINDEMFISDILPFKNIKKLHIRSYSQPNLKSLIRIITNCNNLTFLTLQMDLYDRFNKDKFKLPKISMNDLAILKKKSRNLKIRIVMRLARDYEILIEKWFSEKYFHAWDDFLNQFIDRFAIIVCDESKTIIKKKKKNFSQEWMKKCSNKNLNLCHMCDDWLEKSTF